MTEEKTEAEPKEPQCPLCGRMLGETNIDRHHLIPKSRKGKDQYPIHKICHRKIHATFTEKELARRLNTWELLKEQPEIKVFVEWVQKKDPGYYDGSSNSKRKR